MKTGCERQMIGIIDYDAGNIKSVEKALAYIGEETIVSRDPEVLLKADKAILPGVGSFGQAMENLHRYNLVPVIKDMVKNNTPFLGICLGLQLLFESSEETPGVEGIGILKGKILRIPPAEGLGLHHRQGPDQDHRRRHLREQRGLHRLRRPPLSGPAPGPRACKPAAEG